jgi:hypothetical protein
MIKGTTLTSNTSTSLQTLAADAHLAEGQILHVESSSVRLEIPRVYGT